MYLPSLHHPGRFCISSRVSCKQLLRLGYFLRGLMIKSQYCFISNGDYGRLVCHLTSIYFAVLCYFAILPLNTIICIVDALYQ